MKHHRILSFFVVLFTLLILLSFGMFFTFLHQNNLSWDDYWQKSDLYGSIRLPELKFSKGIKTVHKEIVFPSANKIRITVDIETISFVEEEREDILVVYNYRHPHAPEYNIDFKTFTTNDEIQIIAVTQAKSKNNNPFASIQSDGLYRGSVEIRLPKDYPLESLSLTTSVLNIEQDMLYPNAQDYILTSSMGNIDFIVNKPKRMISVDSDLGNISVLAEEKVEVFDLISNLGNVYLNFQKQLSTLYLVNSFGTNTILLEEGLDSGNVQNNVGDIRLYSRAVPKSLLAFTLSGDITAYINENPSTYLDSIEGHVTSFFPVVDLQKEGSPALYITSNAGNIKLQPASMDVLRILKADISLSLQYTIQRAEEEALSRQADATAPTETASFSREFEAPLNYHAPVPASGTVSGSSVNIRQ